MSCQYNQSNSQVQIEHLYMRIDYKNYMNNFRRIIIQHRYDTLNEVYMFF